MSKRKFLAFALPAGADRPAMQWEPKAKALEHYRPNLRMADGGDSGRVVQIFGAIGVDWWTGEGNTVATVKAKLSELGAGPITVEINSAGGDFFEGVGIYNVLQAWESQVTVKIIGIAASAASLIAMAGDVIEMPKASLLMIHNVWTMAVGDRHDMAETISVLETFDDVSATVYADRSGQTVEAVADMMDAETFLSGEKALELGFATKLSESKVVEEPATTQNAMRQVEKLARDAGMTRSERRNLNQCLRDQVKASLDRDGKPRAAEDGTPRAPEVSGKVLDRVRASLDSLKTSFDEKD